MACCRCRYRYTVCRWTTYGTYQTPFRIRSSWNDGGHHGYLRRRLLPIAFGGNPSGKLRYHFLCYCGILWSCKHQEHTVYGGSHAACGPGGYYNGSYTGLYVLWLRKKYLLCLR